EQEERQAGEVIAVEMRDQDEIDRVALDAEAFQCRQRRGAAIDQKVDGSARDVKAGVLPAAGTERVAATDELQLHRPCPCRRPSVRAARRTPATAARPGSR